MADVKLVPKLTQAGLRALFDADKNEVRIKISHIGFGEGAYKPTGLETSLKDEKIRVPVLSAKVYKELGMIDFSTIVPKDNVPNFWIREIGFFSKDGTLIFVWSDPEIIIAQKTQFIELLQGLRVYLTEVDTNLIEVVEAKPDVKLLYFEEFLSTSNAIINLSSSILRINKQLFKAQNDIKTHNLKIDEIDNRLEKIENDYYSFKPDLKELVLSLTLQNIILSKKLIKLELQLKNLI